MSSRLASRRSFFYRRNAHRIRLRNLRARLAQPKTHLSEQSLALPNAQHDPVALAQMFGQDWSIPQASFKSEVARGPAQIRLNAMPLRFVQRTRTSGPLAFSQSVKTALLEASDPSLDCRGGLTQQLAYFGARVPVADQQHSVQPMVISRLLTPLDFLPNRQLHDFRICNFQLAHGRLSKE
jgi:hypothetical protein